MKHSILLNCPPRNMRPLAVLVATAFAAVAVRPAVALADIYHTVQTGESLAAIAAHYHVAPDALRSANRLGSLPLDDALPQMMIVVPEGKASAGGTIRVDGRMTPSAPISGTISQSLTYMVQPGDTWESIAARHAQAGYRVTADAIKARNPECATLAGGQTLTIPLQSTTYRVPVVVHHALRTITSQADSVDGATVSAEMTGSTWVAPIAREVPAMQPPVYLAPELGSLSRHTHKAPRSVERGPVSLSSRGYFPSPNIEGVRVLGPQEDAPNLGRTPQPRVRYMTPVRPQPTRVAFVAKIASSGARIRRLPDAAAATLYRCGTGTEIAVIKQSGPWAAILMSDRSTGWVPARYLRMTGQSVDISSQVITDSGNITRGNGLAVGGNFSSDTPVVAQALTWLGTPYVYGGESHRGIDCSSLVQHAFRACGYALPRTAAEQARVGRPVNPADLQSGDRLYFSASGSRIDHTGLYMGNGLFVQASGSGRAVIVSRLTDRRNWNIFVGARR